MTLLSRNWSHKLLILLLLVVAVVRIVVVVLVVVVLVISERPLRALHKKRVIFLCIYLLYCIDKAQEIKRD